MQRSSKIYECSTLIHVVLNRLEELKQDLGNDFKNVLRSVDAVDIDDIKDPEIYSIASDLEFAMQDLSRKMEELTAFSESLVALDLSKI